MEFLKTIKRYLGLRQTDVNPFVARPNPIRQYRDAAVLGHRVRRILEVHAENVSFFLPETGYAEAEEHLAALVVKRGGDPSKALVALKAMAALVTIVDDDIYRDFEAEARKRLGARDPEDWPILAAALALGCPIWTEDTDFFGCGVATWTSGSIDIFLAQ